MGKSLDEQETTITWLRSDEYASIYSSDSTMITRFDKFVATGDWEVIREERVLGEVVGKWYRAPKSLLYGRPAKLRRKFSDEERKALSVQMKARREAQDLKTRS